MVGNIHRDYFSYMYHNGTDKRCSPYHSVACSDDSDTCDRILCDAVCIADNRKYTLADDMIRQKVVSTMADAATSAVSGGDSYSDKGGLTEEAVKKVLKAAGVSEEKLESYGISIADIVSGKVSSDDLAKYGISANVLDGLKNSGNESVENAIENADIPESLQETLIKSADIPAAFKNLLLKNNNKATYQKLGVTTFAQYAGAYIAKQVINIIAFILTFIVVTIILRAVVFALDIVTELPGVGALNHLAGGLFGMGIALVIVWIIFMVITLMYTTDIGKEIYRMVEDNTLLKLIYDGNPIMKLATGVKY